MPATPLCNIPHSKLDWLIPNLIPRGSITLLAAEPGAGKSTFALSLAAQLSTRTAPDARSERRLCEVKTGIARSDDARTPQDPSNLAHQPTDPSAANLSTLHADNSDPALADLASAQTDSHAIAPSPPRESNPHAPISNNSTPAPSTSTPPASSPNTIDDPRIAPPGTSPHLPIQLPLAPHDTLLLSAEDHASTTLVPRLAAFGADLSRIHLTHRSRRIVSQPDPYGHLKPHTLSQRLYDAGTRCRENRMTTEDLRLRADPPPPTEDQRRNLDLTDSTDIEDLLISLDELPNPALIIVDTIGAHLGDKDAASNKAVRKALDTLGTIARTRNIAILVLCHLSKTHRSAAVHRAAGSLYLASVARSMLTIERNTMLPEHPATHFLIPIKSNFTALTHAIPFSFTSPSQRAQHPQPAPSTPTPHSLSTAAAAAPSSSASSSPAPAPSTPHFPISEFQLSPFPAIAFFPALDLNLLSPQAQKNSRVSQAAQFLTQALSDGAPHPVREILDGAVNAYGFSRWAVHQAANRLNLTRACTPNDPPNSSKRKNKPGSKSGTKPNSKSNSNANNFTKHPASPSRPPSARNHRHWTWQLPQPPSPPPLTSSLTASRSSSTSIAPAAASTSTRARTTKTSSPQPPLSPPTPPPAPVPPLSAPLADSTPLITTAPTTKTSSHPQPPTPHL
ncbi:MAG: AAA family ATPase [Planctomycetes bacterium]|nr:AAA family ATPase [Planctomycetota bacterium]